jgi:hypothetical protein
MNRFDRLVSELCGEIDVLDGDAEYWKSKYEEIKLKYDSLLDSSIAASHRASLGMLAIATNDKELAEAIANSGSNSHDNT